VGKGYCVGLTDAGATMKKVHYSVEVHPGDDLVWIGVYQVQVDGRRSLVDSRSFRSFDDGMFWARVVIQDFIGDRFE
jgi:hypothetical protein